MTQKSPLLVASVAAAGLGMVMYDNTAVTVALPAIRDAFHTDTSSLQWMLNGLSLMTGSMLPFSGALGDRFGPKRTFRAGILLFAAAALMGSFSTSIGMLIGFRVLQGFGGALLLPNSTALLNANVTPETRNHTVGLWISISATGLIVGPLGGGLLISHFGWRAALYGHTVIALFGAWRIGKLDDGPRRENSLDFPGIFTASATALALCAGLIQFGRRHANYPLATTLIVLGLLLGYLFYRIEHRVEHPLVDPSWLTDVRTRGVLLACAIYNGTIAASTFLISVLSQDSRHLSPLQGGIVVWMSCILMPVGSRISGRIKNVPDLRKIMLRGSIALSVGYVIIAALSQGPFLLMLATLSIAGFCAGLLFSGDTIAILNILEPAKASSGLATLSLVRQIGAVFGIALIGSASELFGRATSIDNGKSLAIALAGVATLSCYFLLKKALTATVHD